MCLSYYFRIHTCDFRSVFIKVVSRRCDRENRPFYNMITTWYKVRKKYVCTIIIIHYEGLLNGCCISILTHSILCKYTYTHTVSVMPPRGMIYKSDDSRLYSWKVIIIFDFRTLCQVVIMSWKGRFSRSHLLVTTFMKTDLKSHVCMM